MSNQYVLKVIILSFGLDYYDFYAGVTSVWAQAAFSVAFLPEIYSQLPFIITTWIQKMLIILFRFYITVNLAELIFKFIKFLYEDQKP